MSLKIDLTKLKNPKQGKFESIELGPYTFTVDENKTLQIKSNNTVIAEYKNGDWLLNGYSIESMWKCLENHYEAIKNLSVE